MLYGAGVVPSVEVAGVPSQGLRQSATHMKLTEPWSSRPAVFALPPGDRPAVAVEPGPAPEAATSRLLEQLMQIARTSALEEMASGFAHELNQPIGAIATFAQAAERMLSRPEPMTPAALDVLRHISNEALNAGQGIRRIRKLFNDATVARLVCSMNNDVLSELMPVLELLASRAGAELEIAIDDALPLVSVDRLRIQHVLYTLVQNSLEVRRPEQRPARVRLEMTGDRYAVTTAVVDNGVGLTTEARAQLFRPFFTTKDRGTGLGLASSRAIVEAHEGAIGCEDVDGGGARFWFRLPAAIA